MKVIFINNYSMDLIWKEWQKQESAGHHLWGTTNFDKYGIDCHILTHEKYTLLKKISKKIKFLGDLDQQLRILWMQDDFDLVYCAQSMNTLLLSLMRSIGLFNKPIVAIAHEKFEKTWATNILINLFVKGYDTLVCLSEKIKDQYQNEFSFNSNKLDVLEWGVDLPFYDYNLEKTDSDLQVCDPPFFLTAGRTYRDYETLTTAFESLDCQLKIYCTKDSAPINRALAKNIKVFYHPQKLYFLSHAEIFAEHKRAYAVAIPLDINPRKVSYTMIGLTSLLDALALGKAVIMTKYDHINIDIEKEGIGLWVKPGDVAGWRKAVSYLLEHPNETQEMGKRARLLCEQKYNLDLFSQEIARIINQTYIKNQNKVRAIRV